MVAVDKSRKEQRRRGGKAEKEVSQADCPREKVGRAQGYLDLSTMGTRRGQLEILDGQMGMAKSDKSSREELMKWKWKWKKPGRGWSRMLRPAGDWRGGLAAEQPNTNITNLTAVWDGGCVHF